MVCLAECSSIPCPMSEPGAARHHGPERYPQGTGETKKRADQAIYTDSGATAVEYALMVGFIAAVIAGSVAVFGQAVMRLFQMPVGLF